MLRLLFFPFTLVFWLAFGLLALPFVLLRFALRLVGALIVLPIVLVLTLIGLLVGGLAFSVVFFLPLLLAACVVWVLIRLASPRPI